AKQLVKRHGLAYCAAHTDEFSVPVLRALAKVAEDYGKNEFRAKFLPVIREQRERTRRNGSPGSMLEALSSIGATAAPYAWFSVDRDDRVVLHTWRSPDPGRMDGWRIDNGRWTLDSRWSAPDVAWKSLPQYAALLRALDTQASVHGDVVYAALSTDISAGQGPAKRQPGSNVLLTNEDGNPARFKVTFDLGRRWHRVELLDGQDCNVGTS